MERIPNEKGKRGRKRKEFSQLQKSAKYERLSNSPLREISIDEKIAYFSMNLDELKVIVESCQDSKILKEVQKEERKRISEVFSPFNCLKLYSQSKLPRNTLNTLHLMEPNIFPSLYKFGKLKDKILKSSTLQPQQTRFGYRLDIKALLDFLFQFVYHTSADEITWISFSFDGTVIGKHSSLLAAIRFISHTNQIQSNDDLFTVYRGWCSEDNKTEGMSEMYDLVQKINQIAENGITARGVTYKIKLLFTFDLKAMWKAIGRGGANSTLFCSHCNCTKNCKKIVACSENEKTTELDISSVPDKMLPNCRPKKWKIEEKVRK